MNKDEALKMALEALDTCVVTLRGTRFQQREFHESKVDKAITAIKEALAQPDAFEQGRQEGMKQERALWTLTKLGQEIEAQPAQETVADAARYQHIKGMARAMSLDMGGNHYWHIGLREIRGPNLDEAIDRSIRARGQA